MEVDIVEFGGARAAVELGSYLKSLVGQAMREAWVQEAGNFWKSGSGTDFDHPCGLDFWCGETGCDVIGCDVIGTAYHK